jgi:hypothetical protein
VLFSSQRSRDGVHTFWDQRHQRWEIPIRELLLPRLILRPKVPKLCLLVVLQLEEAARKDRLPLLVSPTPWRDTWHGGWGVAASAIKRRRACGDPRSNKKR